MGQVCRPTLCKANIEIWLLDDWLQIKRVINMLAQTDSFPYYHTIQTLSYRSGKTTATEIHPM